MDLNTIWFALVGVLLTGYAVLDGFDLGTGALILFVKDDTERRIFFNAIGPVWNGNEVWLVTGGGALFAAFPNVYATVFSGFYDAFMLLLAALIFRAAAIEFRGQYPGARWRATWDTVFAVASIAGALLIGVAMGNLVWGIPLDAHHEFHGDFFMLLKPYTLLVALTGLALFAMHANLYLLLKTEGALQQRLAGWTKRTIPIYLVLFALMNIATIVARPMVREALQSRLPLLGAIFTVSVLITFNIVRLVKRERYGLAFISSAGSIVTLMMLFGAAIYPNLVFSWPDPANSLNIVNGASTAPSLKFMLVVALIGVPIVLAYTASIYYVFRGKVTLTDHSY
jgi:cytochrome d ubiquinol oxidase subunit II